MQCEEIEDRLNAVLDERKRIEWDAEMRLHCDACPSCRALAAEYDALLDGFYALSTPEAPADMSLRVMAEMYAAPRVSLRSPALAVAMAIAAGLLIALVPLVRNNSREQAATEQVIPAKRDIVRRPAATPLASLGVLPEFLSIASADPRAFENLAKGTGQSLATVVLYVPGIGGTSGIIDAGTNGDDDEPAWAVEVSEGLKPVTDSVTETLNLLLRSIPVADLASRS